MMTIQNAPKDLRCHRDLAESCMNLDACRFYCGGAGGYDRGSLTSHESNGNKPFPLKKHNMLPWLESKIST